jgi:hypothetical protein
MESHMSRIRTTRLQEAERKQHVLIIDQLPLPSFPFSVILTFILPNNQT